MSVVTPLRALPLWVRVVLALVLALAAWWVLRSLWAGGAAFVAALLGVRRPAPSPGPGRALGRAEGGVEAEAAVVRSDAAEVRAAADEVRARDAAVDADVAAEVRHEVETSGPPDLSDGWSPAPRSEAVARWFRRGR